MRSGTFCKLRKSCQYQCQSVCCSPPVALQGPPTKRLHAASRSVRRWGFHEHEEAEAGFRRRRGARGSLGFVKALSPKTSKLGSSAREQIVRRVMRLVRVEAAAATATAMTSTTTATATPTAATATAATAPGLLLSGCCCSCWSCRSPCFDCHCDCYFPARRRVSRLREKRAFSV